jgi:hypothetical protein
VHFLALEQNGITPGEEAYSFGIPLGFLEGSFSSGVVAAQMRERAFEGGSYREVQFTAPISQGNSGGPLINAQGKVMGIITSTYVYGEDLNLATFIEELQHIDRTYERSVEEFFLDTEYYRIKLGESMQSETEPNNTAENAEEIESGDTYRGEISGTNKDIFTFTVTGEEAARLKLVFVTNAMDAAIPILTAPDNTEISVEWIFVELEQGAVLCYNSDVEANLIDLAPGTYTVTLQGVNWYVAGKYFLYAYWRPVSEAEGFAYAVPPTDFLP